MDSIVSEHAGPVYELTLCVDTDVAHGLDAWLADLVTPLLDQPGVSHAETSRLDDPSGRESRVVRFYLESDENPESCRAGPAATLQQQMEDRFGARCVATRRILRPGSSIKAATPALPHCLNCDAVLNGQYCGRCGQRARSRLISVWELLKDALGDLLDADSRLWQTLLQLAFRPGRLTCEYLRGRRARYMPPFRTYLVLSLVFFVIVSFDPHKEFSILFEPVAEVEQAQGSPVRQEVLDDLVAEGILIRPAEAVDGTGTGCNLGDYDAASLPGWLGRRLSRDRVQLMCDRMIADGGQGLRGFVDKLLEYVPAGLIILLPIMALVLKLLYPFSRRYYVEHLLLILHYHAFVFLVLTVQTVVSRLGALFGALDTIVAVTLVALSFYIPVYLYKTLRRVYGQGHLLTTVKFSLMTVAYSTGLFMLLLGMSIVAAFTV